MENLKLIELLEQFKAETKQPAIRLTTRRSDHITATNSKFGGLPYLPKNFAYPTDSKGNPLKLLAQLNFAELPPLADFPTSGILQFFVLPDESIGLDSVHKVIYHAEIHENDRMTDFPEVKYISKSKYHKEWFPFEGEFAVTGELVEVFPAFDTWDFEIAMKSFDEFAKKHQIDMKSREINDAIDEFFEDDEDGEDLDEWHLIGGCPFFMQGDPREGNRDLKKYDTLLFQMSSDYMSDDWETEIPQKYQIMWGDAGVANFFINRQDLRNLKFDDVLYNWDCC